MDRFGGPDGHHDTRLPHREQEVIDAEVRATRRDVLTEFRHRLRSDPQTLVAEDFLTVADRAVVHSAIIIAAGAVADACDLQIPDPHTGRLRIARHRGIPAQFLRYFATVDAAVPSTCGAALATGKPVLVEDITTSPIFAGQPTLGVMLAAGSRSVQSYPLRHTRGDVIGMLSLYYRTVGRHPGQDRLAAAAAWAMAGLSARAVTTAAGAPAREPEPTQADVIITTTCFGDMTTVVVRGALDAVSAPGCAESLNLIVAGLAAHRFLVIDIREVDFLAAAGARVLINVAHACAARDVPCYLLVGDDPTVRMVLDHFHSRPPLQIIDDPGAAASGRRPQP